MIDIYISFEKLDNNFISCNLINYSENRTNYYTINLNIMVIYRYSTSNFSNYNYEEINRYILPSIFKLILLQMTILFNSLQIYNLTKQSYILPFNNHISSTEFLLRIGFLAHP